MVDTVGFTGSRGDIGTQGWTGYTGSIGNIGYFGSKGFTGSKGDIGSQGWTGYTGSTGYRGSLGYSGSMGYTGSIGNRGPIGETGYTGSASTIVGYWGSKGATGATGSGSTGPAGPAGSNGATGATGPAGPPGNSGGSGLTSRITASGGGSLGIGATGTYSITGFIGYGLYKIYTSAAAWVVIYDSVASRTADINAARDQNTDPLPSSGIIAEAITSGEQTVKLSPGTVGFSDESPATTDIPIKVTNLSGISTTITVTLTLVCLEV
jgi:hypothetical protein